jgi:hypothetical protein
MYLATKFKFACKISTIIAAKWELGELQYKQDD